MTFKIQKKYLLSLGNWLNSLSLAGRESRARTRFVALIQEALERADKDRKAILEDYAEKNEDGTMKTDAENNAEISDDKRAAFDTEVVALYNEDAELSGPETGPVFVMVKNIVLDYDKEIDPSIAGAYDMWCQAFEEFPAVAGM